MIFRDSVPKWEKEEFDKALLFLTGMIISHILLTAIFDIQLVTLKLQTHFLVCRMNEFREDSEHPSENAGCALAQWLIWLEHHPVHQKVQV